MGGNDAHSSIERLPPRHVDFQARQLQEEQSRAQQQQQRAPPPAPPRQDTGPIMLGQTTSDSFPKKRATFATSEEASVKPTQDSFKSGLRRDSSMLRSQMTVNNLLTFVNKGGERRDRPDNFGHDVTHSKRTSLVAELVTRGFLVTSKTSKRSTTRLVWVRYFLLRLYLHTKKTLTQCECRAVQPKAK